MDISRNWGFITAEEQELIGAIKVAVAGAGGDGGLVALHLARLGVRHFAIADPEHFQAENANRQAGCDITTLGRNKAEVIAQTIRQIAPQASVTIYPDGISPASVTDFVQGAAVVIDETEYTRPHLSLMLARAARPSGIPVVSGLNVGFGAIVTCFLPGSMTLEPYLGLPPQITIDRAERFQLPLRRWVVRLPSYTDERGLRVVASGVPAPSVAPGVALAAGLVVTEVFKVLTGRQRPVAAPCTLVFDALEGKTRVVRFRSRELPAPAHRTVTPRSQPSSDLTGEAPSGGQHHYLAQTITSATPARSRRGPPVESPTNQPSAGGSQQQFA